jgi:hypothetical protein
MGIEMELVSVIGMLSGSTEIARLADHAEAQHQNVATIVRTARCQPVDHPPHVASAA